MDLPPVLDDQIGHAGLGALGDDEGSLGARFIQRGDLERRRGLRRVEPEHRQATVAVCPSQAHAADEALEVAARLAGAHDPFLIAAVAQHADPGGPGQRRARRRGRQRDTADAEKVPSSLLHPLLLSSGPRLEPGVCLLRPGVPGKVPEHFDLPGASC